jgi:hypothetical protein
MSYHTRQEDTPTWPRRAVIFIWASGVLMGASAMHLLNHSEKPATPPVQRRDDSIIARLDRIEAAANQASMTRCMNVTTPALTVSVYNTENLGNKPLPKPAYDKPVPKGAANVPQVPGEDAGPEVRSEP